MKVLLKPRHDSLANKAIAAAFETLPAHLKRTLTWDQGVEMARHQELAAANGIRIYFAERVQPLATSGASAKS